MRNNMIYFIIMFGILTTPKLHSQTFQSGIIAEGALLSTEIYNIYVENGSITNEYTKKEFLRGFSLAYSAKLHLGLKYYLELRPGIMLSQNAFDGVQLGAYIRKEFNIYTLYLGINSNSSFGSQHGISNSESPVGTTNSYVIGLGVRFNKIWRVLASYNKLFDNYFGAGTTHDLITVSSHSYKKYLHYYLKLGIELNL